MTLFFLNCSRWFQSKFLKKLECKELEIQINGEYLNNHKLADDIVLMNEPTDKLQLMILQLQRKKVESR